MSLKSLPTALTASTLRNILDQFRTIKGASVAVLPNTAEVFAPNGTLVFKATKFGNKWLARAIPGLVNPA
jgi:hypothetical protein